MIRALGPGSVSSFLKVILDVFYVVLWAVGLPVRRRGRGPAADQLRSAGAAGGGAGARRDHGPRAGPQAAVRLIGAELSLIGVLVIVQRLRKVFGAMTAGDPFHPDNVRRLRVIALVLALIEINGYAFGALDRFVLAPMPTPPSAST